MQNSIHSAVKTVLTLIVAALAPAAISQPLYWDGNDTAAGAGPAPVGAWGTDVFWNSLLDGTGTPEAWTAGREAVFSAGTDATGAFTVTVTGTQTAGALRIEEGTVTLAVGTAALGAGNLTVENGATLSTDSSLRISATAGATLNINGGKLRTTNPGAAGTFYDADFAVTIGAAGATFEHVTANILNIVQTAMTIGGPGGLTKTGAGVLAIAGTATYAGPTIINEGELRIRTTANRIPVGTAVTVNYPGILNLNSVAQQIGSLSGNGDVGLGAATLMVGDATSSTYSGGLKNVANAGAGGVTTGSGRVIKTGSGTLTLTGTNTYTGSLTVSNGAVTVASGAILCDPLADIVLQGGALNLDNAAQTILSLSGNGGALNLGSGHTLTVNPGNTRTNAGTIAGAGALNKTGAGTLVLSGDNTYGGGTTIAAGSIRVANTSGSATGTGDVTVQAGGSLSGPGTVAGNVTVSGVISPGASPGTQNTGSEIWNGGGSYVWEINDVDAGLGTDPGWDLINITGTLTINATSGNKFNINITSLTLANAAGDVNDFANANDYAWTILKTTAGISGFDAAAFNLNASGFSNPLGSGVFAIETANGGNDLVLRFVHPPSIVAGPVGGTVECGSTFNFSVSASGSEPLMYQWKHADTNLPGANASTLSVTTSTETAGAYLVEISNAYGTTAGSAELVVQDGAAPNIVCAPGATVECGTPWNFTAPSASDICSGANVTVTVLTTVTNPITGGYTVTRTWEAKDQANLTATCSQTITALDTVAPALTCPADITACAAGSGAIVNFTPVSTDACDATPNIICNPPSGSEFLIGTNQVSCTATDDAGNSTNCTFNVVISPGTAAAGPGDASVCTGGTLTLSTVASGTGPFTYQWRKGSEAMVNETNSSITVTGATAADATNYCVEVTGLCNSITNCASVSLNESVNATGPNNATACAGSTVILATTASGAGPFTYVWRKDGNALANETNSSLTLANVGPGDIATYCVEITGACASVTNCASLAVNPVPVVSVNSETICVGQSATLTATHNAANASYLWAPDGQTTASITVNPNSTTLYTVTVTDGTTTCSANAQGTVTVNPLPSVSVNSVDVCALGSAVLTATTDATNASYLWDNGATTASITVSPGLTTTYTCTVTDGNTGCSQSDSGTVTVHGWDTFVNTTPITVNDLAAASPYPSPITVSGLTATVCRVTVTLHGLTHDFPDDLDIALMGPDGQVTLLMSDVGNGHGVSGINLAFADFASNNLPDATQIVGGTFKPSNIGAKSDGSPDNFPAPAPTIRYMTNLSIFNGINPNGVWSLFAYDDELVDAGQIAGGWSIAISTLEPIADVGITQLDVPDPVGVGSNLTYTVVVSNSGPALASGVLASDTPPAGATLVSFGASQGACTLVSGTIWCELGSIAPGAAATITVVVSPNAAGTLVNTASVQSDDVDFNSANNSSTASTTVLNPPVITTGPQSQIVCTDQSVTFSVTATGEPPLSYQWYFGIDPISGANASTLTLTAVQPAASGGYAVIVQNAVGATSASANLTVNPLPVVSIAAASSEVICLGASVTLTANNNASNPSYVWSPGGATTPSIIVSPASTTVYSVLVTDGTTTCTNSASTTITVNQPTTATALTSVTNACPGTSVSFSTTVGGTGPHTYVWRKNGTLLPAETGPSLTLASVIAGDGGTYCVEVTGACNSVTNCATLSVAAAPTITSQPQSISRPMGNSASFSVTANGVAPITYQWLLNGSPIAGETGTTLNVLNLTLAQNGNQYSVVASNCGGTTTSAAATLTVTPIAGISFDFDTPGQYTNTHYNVRLNDWLHTGLQFPILMSEAPAGGVNNSGAIDLQGTADSTTHFHPLSYDFSQNGKILVASVMVRIVAPTQNNRNTQLGFITQTNAYAGTAPGLTGAGINDNNPIGFMSVILQSTAQPALTYELRLQHRRTDGGITEVTPTPTPTATLVAGNWYKLVATFQNITATAANTMAISASLTDMGPNGLVQGAVALSYPPTNIVNTSMVTQRNVHLAIRSARSDTGADLWDNVHAYATPGPVFFVAQPSSQTVPQGSQATFYALVDGAGPYKYQWNKNGSPIPGAGNWKYITPATTLSQNGEQYTVTVTGPDGTTITSDPATLTVQANTLSLVSVGSVDGTTVGVQFNQPVDKISAENAANYLINGTPAACAVVYTSSVDPLPTRVLLIPAGVLAGPYTVTVQNVQDLSGNAIGASNSANGGVAGLLGVDINPVVAGPVGQNYSFGPGQFEIMGGGTDIFGAPDAFRYVYAQKTGDFDVKVRVPYQDVVRGPTKTGFEVRVSLDPASPHVLAGVNPRWPARQLYEGTFRQAWNVGGSSWGAAGTVAQYPNAWLRFRRVGNTFLRYSSQNGTTWQLDGQVTPSPALPDTMLFGFAVCSVANNFPQTASFDNYGDFAGYPGATISITTQPITAATVTAGGSSNLTVVATATGAPSTELNYVWQRHAGGGVWTNVGSAGQTNATFNTGTLWAPDNGAQYRVVVKVAGAADVISSTTTVTVTDAGVPTITAATIPSGSMFQVVVTYSEPVAAASALNVANYIVSNSLGVVMGTANASFLGGDPRVVVLTTANQLVTGNYSLRVSGVQDIGGNTIVAVNRALTQFGNPPQIGPVVVEFYSGLTNGGNIGDLTNNVSSGPPGVKFAADTPDFIVYSNVFGINPTAGNFASTIDHYGVQMYAYFVPATSGAYKFYVRADDFAQFLMNTNAVGSTNPAGAVLQVALAANAQAYSLANSVTNTLVGGQRYYMELRFKESTGGDGGTVAVRTDNTVPGQGEVLSGAQLAFPDAITKPTPVAVELYTGQVTVNSILPNDLGAAFGSGGYPDLLASLNTPAFVARIPNVIGNARYFGYNSNLSQINATFDNYLGRIYANFVAPSNGLYKFYARSDDSCQLWMNTNAANSTDPAGITFLGATTDFYDVNQRLLAQNVYLNGGQSYYMEGRWRDGGGGDGMTVTFRAQSDLSIPPNTEFIPPARLEFPSNYDRVGPVDAEITPSAPIAAAGQTITFQAANVRGAPAYTFTWLKNGVVVGANTTTYITQPLTSSDNGAVYTLVVQNPFSRVERSTTVSVVADNTAPTILGAVGSQYQDLVVLTFSEPVALASGSAAINYAGDNGLRIFSATVDQTTGRRVTLRTSQQNPGTTYTITVNNVADSAGNAIAANTAVAFTAWIASGKGFYVEVWTNIAGTAVANLVGDPRYVNNLPDSAYYTNRLGAGWFGNDTGLNNFGVRLTGLLTPPSNGLYRLYVRGDDGTMVVMNTNGPSPVGRTIVARNDGANSGTWENGVGGSASPVLTLSAGTMYFTEVFMKEGGGGDHLEVMLRTIDPNTLTAIGGVPAPSVNDIVPGDFFTTIGNPDRAQLTVTQTPVADMTVAENDTVTLSARANAPNFELSMATGYRWQVGDGLGGYSNIPGAWGPTHTFVAPATDAQYRVLIGGPGTNVAYSTAVHSSPDLKAPFMISASSLNGTNLDVLFNEPVEASSAVDPFNYTVNGGAVNILGIAQREDPRKVTVTVDAPVGQTFTIEISGVVDLAGNFDFSSVTGRVSGAFVALDVGGPVAAGSTFNVADGEFDVSAGGNDIWGNSDVGHLTLTQVTGDFDVHTRIAGLTRPDAITKGGLMVRETLDANSRTLHTMGNPSQYQQAHPFNLAPLTGRDLGEAAQRFAANNGTAGWQARPESIGTPSQLGNSGFAPVGVPNAWVRLKREGNMFTAFHSYDGVNWRRYAQAPFSYPSTVWLGFGTTAHTASQAAGLVGVANYRDVYIPPAPIILVQPAPASQTVPLHASVFYSVVASNPPPNRAALKYQWFRNGVAIANATSDSLTISDVQGGDAGVYTVQVNNDGGTTTSQPVTLDVDTGLIAALDTLNTTQNTALNIAASTLLGNDSAAAGDTASIMAVSGIFPVTYTADFNNAAVPAGATIFGNTTIEAVGGVDNSPAARLTGGALNQSGSFILNDLSPNRRVTAFNANFKLRIGDGSAEPADGFSFNFAPDLPIGPTTPAAAENGGGSGFSFCVDNYRFHPYPQGNIANSSGLKIRYGNLDVVGVRTATWNSPRWVDVSISITPSGTLSVLVDGTNVFGNVQLPNYQPRTGRFGWYARTGSQFESHWIDDVSISALLTVETTREPAQNTDSERMLGSAAISGGILHLTDAINSVQGTYQTATLNTQAMTSLNANFNVRIGGGTARAADGLSLSIAPDLPNAGFGEEGAGSYLIVSLDTWDNNGTDTAPSFDIKWGGTADANIIATKSFQPSARYQREGGRAPATAVLVDGSNNPVPLDTDVGSTPTFVPVSLTVESDGTLDLSYKGIPVFENLAIPGFYGATNLRVGLGARTGSANDNHWIDDLSVTINTAGGPVVFNNNFSTAPPSPYGTVVLGGSQVIYTPPANVCGTDTFYYLISGQYGGSALGRVDVNIAEAVPEPPVIIACATNRVLAADSSCTVALPDMTAQVTAIDNCCCVTVTQSPPAGTLLPLGTHTVTFTATDTLGLTAQCQATITVTDQNAPVIVLIGDPSVLLECGSGFVDPGATAQDNCDGNLTSSIVVSGVVNPSVPGTYTLTYNVSDAAGNPAAPMQRVVQVADTVAPSIACPANMTAFRGTPNNGEYVYYSVTATDACDATPTVVCTPPSGTFFPLGATTVSCTATDDTGNSSGCSFTVTVKIANILFVSDNPTTGDNAYHPPLVGFPDDFYVLLAQSAGHNVSARFNPPNAATTLLTAQQLADINTNDLILVSRSIGSGAFVNLQASNWNARVTKPLIMTSPYLVRQDGNRLFWFVGGNGVLPDTTPPTRMRAMDTSDPETAFLFDGVAMNGDTMVDSFDERNEQNTSTIVNAPTAGGKQLATATFVPLAGGAAVTANIITEFPAGTAVPAAVGGSLAGYRMFFAAGTREIGATGIPLGAGRDNLTPAGEDIFKRALLLALHGGVAPIDRTSPLGFVTQPVDVTVEENRPATFSVTLTGAPPRTVQWQRDTGDATTFTNIPGASATWLNSSYVIASVTPADAGYYRVVASNPFGTVTSLVAQLTVLPDTNGPTIVRAVGKWTLTNITVSFSEPITADSANDIFNYEADNGLSIVGAVLDATGTNVFLSTSVQTPGTVYTLTINGIEDRAAVANMIAADSTVSFTAWVATRGFLISEIFLNIPGNAITALTTNPVYPNFPDRAAYVNVSSNAPAQGETYGGRLVGWIVPPVDGSYTFYIRGDDGTELRLSPSADPEARVMIASQASANQPYTSGASAPQALVGGQRYFVEALWKEGTGGDYMQFAWQTPGSTNIEALACEYLEQYANPEGVLVNIVSHPANGNVFENRSVTFSVAANITPANSLVCYQWQKGDGGGGYTNIHAPNSATFATPLLRYPEDDGSLWRVIVSVPGASATSQVATVTVQDDVVGPVVLSSATLDGLAIGICFDEALDPSTAVDGFNYSFTEGSMAITSIVLRADGRSVQLKLDSPLPVTAMVTIDGVLDLAGNLMDTANLSPHRHGLTAQDIGGPGLAGSHFTCDADRIELVGGGTDIWGNADMAQFAYRSVTGDFDARVRVTSLAGSDPITKAALLVRETTDGGSRTIHVNVNPANGRNTFEPGQRTTTGGATATWGTSFVPAGIPNCWLRITRTGDNWNGYHSTNGADWTLHAQTTQVYPSTVLLGMALTAHNNTLLATGSFSGFTVTQPVADVAITKLDAPDPAYVGGNVTYTISVTNAGPDAATGAVVTDVLPAGTTFVSAVASQGSCTNVSGTVTCNLGTLNSGGSATVTIVVTANSLGAKSNTATVASNASDPVAGNNSATAITTVVAPPSLTGTAYAAGTFSASFQSYAGYTYEIRHKNNLTDPTWTLLTTIPGDGSVKSFSDPNAGTVPHRFYIILVVP